MPDILSLQGIIGPAILIGIAVGCVFWKTDDALSSEAKDDIALAISCGDIKRLPRGLISVFDWVLSDKCPSFVCFIRSIFVTFTVFTILGIDFMSRTTFLGYEFVVYLLIGGLLFNCIPDFISLTLSRRLVSSLENNPKILFAFLIAAVDIILTLIICSITIFIAAYLFSSQFSGNNWPFQYISFEPNLVSISTLPLVVLQSILEYFRDPGSRIAMFGLYAISTFVGTFWLWTYTLGFLISSQLHKLQVFVNYALPLYTNPLRSIGVVGGFVAAATYFLYAALSLVAPPEFGFIPESYESWIIKQQR